MNKIAKSLMLISLLCCAAFGDFEGISSGTFINPVGSSTDMDYLSGVGTNHIETGKPIPFVGSKTELTFTGNDIDTEVCSPFKIGELCYYNGLSKPGTRIDGITLAVETTFTEPEFLQDVYFADLDFDFYLLKDCLTMENAGVKYDIADSGYCLEILGFNKKYCRGISDKLCVLEGHTGYSDIYAKISDCQVIPAPGAVFLAGIGVSFVGWLKTRKQT